MLVLYRNDCPQVAVSGSFSPLNIYLDLPLPGCPPDDFTEKRKHTLPSNSVPSS